MAERLYLEDVKGGQRLRPVHPGADGQGLGQSEDDAAVLSRPLGDLRRQRQPAAGLHGDGGGFLRSHDRASSSTADGKLNDKVDIPLPVDGLLNPELAHRFDDFTEKNSAYTLSPATIAANLDKDFETLHPKQLRRVVLGPFYSAGITENNSTVTEVLAKVRKPENAWLLTWTIQEVYSKGEKPGRKGLWSSEKATQEFYINTDDLEAARQGVSSYEKHALVPHEAYQALYAAGEAQKIFVGLQGAHPVQGTGDQRCVTVTPGGARFMDTGLTTIPEADIEKHRATAQSMITRVVVLEDPSRESGTALAGTGRRFVSTVSAGSVRRTREVELAKTVAADPSRRPADVASRSTRCSIRARRGLAMALAVADVFAAGTDLESLQAQERPRAAGRRRGRRTSRSCCRPRPMSRPSPSPPICCRLIDADGEAPNDVAEPDFLFDTPQDALKSLVAGLDTRDRRRQGRRRPDDRARAPSPASPSTGC